MPAIEIQPPNAAWPQAFDQAARWLRHLVGPEAHIEHVGSTAIPGLSAKPVIDILVGLDNGRDIAGLVPIFEARGFVRGIAAGAPKINLFLRRPGADDRLAMNLHLTQFGSCQWRDLIRFRDTLRGDPALALSYETLKRRLAETSADLEAYTAGKSEFVARVLEMGP